MTPTQTAFSLGYLLGFGFCLVWLLVFLYRTALELRRWKFRARVLKERLEARGVQVRMDDKGVWLTWKTESGVPAGFCEMMIPGKE